jgi:hypothetical protein
VLLKLGRHNASDLVRTFDLILEQECYPTSHNNETMAWWQGDRMEAPVGEVTLLWALERTRGGAADKALWILGKIKAEVVAAF